MRAIWPDRTPEGLAFTPAYEVEPASQLIFLRSITPVRDGKVARSIDAQSQACLDNLEDILARIPGNARAVKMVQCMSDVRERFTADAVFDKHYVNELPGRLRPAKTLLEVPAVVNHAARIELEVWAIADPVAQPRVLERFRAEGGALPVAVAVDGGAMLYTVEASPGERAGRRAVEELQDCLDQLEQALGGVGAGLGDLVKLTVAIADLRAWPAVLAAIETRFGEEAPVVVPQSATKVTPAAATIQLEAWAAVARDGARAANGTVASVDLAGQLLVISGSAAIPVYTGQTLKEMYSYQPVAKIVDQTRVSMDNYAHILEAAGASWDDIFKTTWYVTDLREWERIEPVAQEYFGRPIPAPTVVEVSKFVSPAVRIEPDMWATLPRR